jgi:hypothetical protein
VSIHKSVGFCDLVYFVVLGIPLLLIAQLVDVYWFAKHLYTWKVHKLTGEKIKTIDYLTFVRLE